MADGRARNEKSLEDIRFRVHAVDHLPGPRSDEARALLDRAVAATAPMLRRRRWAVLRVSEFYPRSPNLLGLNINHGQHVKVRVRRPVPGGLGGGTRGRGRGRGTRGRGRGRGITEEAAVPAGGVSFFDFEEVCCTLIHEIVHVTISPHNAAFWKLYHELVAEVELDIANGSIPGMGAGFGAAASPQPAAPVEPAFEPFAGNGRQLGAGPCVAQDDADARRAKVLAAAEARLRRSRLPPVRTNLAAAAAQLEGRGCGSQHAVAEPSAAAEPRSSQGPQWECVECGRANHPLLPYCEWCCGDASGDLPWSDPSPAPAPWSPPSPSASDGDVVLLDRDTTDDVIVID